MQGKEESGLSTLFMNEIFMYNGQHYDLRKKTEFKRNNVKIVYRGNENLTSLGPRM